MSNQNHNSRWHSNKQENDSCCRDSSSFQERGLTEQRASVKADRDISGRDLPLENDLVELVGKHQGLCGGKQQHSTSLVTATQDCSVPAHTPKCDRIYSLAESQPLSTT